MAYRCPVQVLVYCYRLVDNEQYWLMLKRVPERGGFWQGVTGAIEPGETLLDAAVREMREETALAPDDIFQTELEYTITVRPEWASKYNYDPEVKQLIEYVFLARLADDAVPTLSGEHSEFAWKTTEQAISMFKWPKNAEALKLVSELV